MAQDDEQPIPDSVLDDRTAGVEVAAASGGELGGQPGKLIGVDGSFGSTERVHRVEDQAAYLTGIERVISLAGRLILGAVAVPLRAAVGVEMFGDGLSPGQRAAVCVRRYEPEGAAEEDL